MRIEQARALSVSPELLAAKEVELTHRFEADLATDAWRRTFRGRDVLKEFARSRRKASYEILRALIISRMAHIEFKPSGMKEVVDAIIAA